MNSRCGFTSGDISDVDEGESEVSAAPWTSSKLLPALHSPNAYAVSMQPESPNSFTKKERTLFTDAAQINYRFGKRDKGTCSANMAGETHTNAVFVCSSSSSGLLLAPRGATEE